MIGNIELTNYRAFKSEKFDFSRLNIFVGPNNSGKSSALSALNLLAQSVSQNLADEGQLILNGSYDQLGTFKDLVNGGRSTTPIRISFTIKQYNYSFEMKYRPQRRQLEITKFKLLYDGDPVYEYYSSKDKYDLIIQGKKIEHIGEGVRKTRPKYHGFIPRFREAIKYSLQRNIVPNSVESEVYTFLRRAEMKINRFHSLVFETFKSYDTLGAFREMPQRTYLNSGETAHKIGRNGQNTVTILANDASRRGKEQSLLVNEVSEWMRNTGIASGIKVKYLTDRHFELVVVGKDGTDHNICDVGFGCSQVLPVLVSGIELLNQSKSRNQRYSSGMLVIQEPEIHLHPNAQAELGTFLAGVTNESSQIFIETHSDNLVLRVAKHVASGDLQSEDVRIFYINDVNGHKQVTAMTIQPDGTFSPAWPGGFFPQRQQESLNLARAAMKSRADSLNDDAKEKKI